MLLPFDAHNHVHMGPTSPVQALLPALPENNSNINNNEDALPKPSVSGMAIMSTHPRDYERVLSLSNTLEKEVEGEVRVVPCLGVHPWFLHELTNEDWTLIDDNGNNNSNSNTPQWIHNLECLLQQNPNAIVGEVGLDGFHFDPHTEELVSPMDKQVEAFRMQMELATKLQRPVSIHTVQCFGPLFDCLNQMKKDAKKDKQKPFLPPKMYFHAYGGKPATVDQLLSLCGKELGKVYFGFAPVINFRSPKTADVVRKVGIERILLETDHEDAKYVPESMEQCIEFLASTLDMKQEDVIEQTTKNSMDFYNLDKTS